MEHWTRFKCILTKNLFLIVDLLNYCNYFDDLKYGLLYSENVFRHLAGFYTRLNIWGSLGLNFDYDGGPIIENGGPICLYMDLL